MAITNTLISAAVLERAAKAAAERAVDKVTAAASGEAQRNAPVEFGDLRANVTIKDAETHGNSTRATFTFEEDYAAVQHEEMGFQHPRGGGPKYAERALIRHAPLLKRIGEEELRRELGS